MSGSMGHGIRMAEGECLIAGMIQTEILCMIMAETGRERPESTLMMSQPISCFRRKGQKYRNL